MCGRSYDPRFLFSWPIGRCSVMGPDQLSGVMGTIAREAAARSSSLTFRVYGSAGKEVDEKELTKRTEIFKKSVEHDSTAYYTSAHVLDDGIIDPRDTRDVLGMCLEIVSGEMIRGNEGFRGVSRM
jgi:acetyl-CoA carboxylase carboxyltransferase component